MLHIQDFTANRQRMLSPRTNSLSRLSALTITLIGASSAFAEINGNYRQEPIYPIPQEIIVNDSKAKLGEMLFLDTRLSKNNSIACISCHHLDAGGDDGVAIGITLLADDQHILNTPSIFNARYNFRQNWDGSSKTLHQQINAAMNSHHIYDNEWATVITTLLADKDFENKFSKVYNDGITKNNIIDAIVEFEQTLITPNSRFDRYLRNENIELTKNEIDGYLIFKELGCISCHQGINIGGNLYQKFGVFYNYIAERGDIRQSDYGRMNITNRQMDAFVFKVPSLRNVAVTAPYLHDGSAETIEEAILIMGKTQLGRILTENEIFLIKSFLYTLTGEYKNKTLDVE